MEQYNREFNVAKKTCPHSCSNLNAISQQHTIGQGPSAKKELYASKILNIVNLVRQRLIEWHNIKEASSSAEEEGGLRLRGIIRSAVEEVLSYNHKAKENRMIRHILHIVDMHETTFLMESKQLKADLVRAYLALTTTTSDPNAITAEELIRASVQPSAAEEEEDEDEEDVPLASLRTRLPVQPMEEVPPPTSTPPPTVRRKRRYITADRGIVMNSDHLVDLPPKRRRRN